MVEILVGVGILTTVILAMSLYFQLSLKVSHRSAHVAQASYLLEEDLEVAKFFRDEGWANISAPTTGTTYYLLWNGTTFATSTTNNVYVDGMFERTMRFDDVYRNANDDIVSSGGTLDPSTREVTATVSWWDEGATTTKSIATYLVNAF